MNTSVDNIIVNIPDDRPASSSFYQSRIELSHNNISHIYSILSYSNLDENWDAYGAKRPNSAAVTKAINFILTSLSSRHQEVFFTAPTPDGDILVELKHAASTLEFIFSGETDDRVIASCNGDFHADDTLNETILQAYLKWLHQ